jgi:GR25 family glycosyltransferase involved in LPS biosynthesis
MDEESKEILKKVGFEFNELCDLNKLIIPRDQFLSDSKYDEVKVLLPNLKKNYSSSMMTSLQKNAEKIQKWPLLNFVRQILNTYGYKMVPIRKADGYTLDGIKKYKRYFQIKKKHENKDESTKVILLYDNEIN